ncbi:serine/arginine-rich splicing factor SR45a isoform X1 [Manihot esculenta]|uniref:RRM domain-containing protein n=1 Tax=Manihot esculenta TaxID=3983 RepID=A0A2C9WCW8_MANES|nr:serine/arginine-rich splicing factor SR45a isoform X1 [Manihot esculenta]OAY57616.1 hypothetical protein MANES_02G110800v8 [Manihot esculenta]
MLRELINFNSFCLLRRRILLAKGIHSLFPHGENSRGLDQDPIRGPGQGPGPDLDTCPGHGPVFVADQDPEVVADAINPGNTLYVTGLPTRVTERDLEEHLSKEGKVVSCFLVVEPRTRISRDFAFVTMDTVEDANRCVKYLNQSVLEGRYITVEKSRRKRPRTPTPGHYLGIISNGDYGYHGRNRGYDDYRRSPRRSLYHGGRDYSPRRSPNGGRSKRERSRSPYSPPYRGSR